MYPKILNFRPVTVCTFDMTLSRDSLLPIVVSRASDQTRLSSRYESRNESRKRAKSCSACIRATPWMALYD